MAFNGMPDVCYFVPHVPIERIWYKSEHLVWEDTDWCLALERSIREDGLASPILIDADPVRKHKEALAAGTTDEFHVYCGHHRVQAMHRIGWTHVPCVIYGGPIPDEWERVEATSVAHIASYFRDGDVVLKHEKLAMHNTMPPESMIYPTTIERYWPSSPLPRRREETLEDEIEEAMAKRSST